MAKDQEIDEGPRMDRIRPPSAGDGGASIPGPTGRTFDRLAPGVVAASAGQFSAVEIIRDQGLPHSGILVADRCVQKGEVIGLTELPRDANGRTLRITANMMEGVFTREHAMALIDKGYAIPTTKAPTVTLGASQRMPREVERAVVPPAGERAVARPQRGAI
jgi:hypothetical protein